ncbi:hypothetical protein R1521_32775 [Rhizobium brockwellii]|uniref:Uncharacterized protein n=1 Tax=Rhizobium brockwellii TaxID=3019932 RepID=A0ABU3YWQ9_9HYPH|nr:hypothetical protein [Rhizobium brockwellii]MDV4183277.1 hypothetical protein [Rhizobium brockwellii]MDV4190288.1 hypothetical protein [Rhizobium brockwellii]
MNNNDLLSRIHDLESVVNGLMIYIAAREAGVDLDTSDEKTRQFLQDNVMRPFSVRENMYEKGQGPLVLAADGYWEGLASGRIPELVQKLKDL